MLIEAEHVMVNKNEEEFKILIPKEEFYSIVNLLSDFEKLCNERNIKFSKYTEEQLLNVLYIYRNWKKGDKPPF